MDQQFRLKWNNHCNTLLQVFGNLLKTETLVDCTIGADGQYLKAHKVVVSACSPYFQSLFTEHFDKHPIIILKDIKFTELQSMIDYMYEGEVNISQDQLPSFLKAAASIQLKGLTQNVKSDSAPPVEPPSHKPIPQLNSARGSSGGGVLSNGQITPSSLLNVELDEGQQRKKRKLEAPVAPSSTSSSPSLVPDLVVPNVILDVPSENNGGTPNNGMNNIQGGGAVNNGGHNDGRDPLLKKEPSEYSGRSDEEEDDGMSRDDGDGWDSNDGLQDNTSTMSDRSGNLSHTAGGGGGNRVSGGPGALSVTGQDMSNVDENNQGPCVCIHCDQKISQYYEESVMLHHGSCCKSTTPSKGYICYRCTYTTKHKNSLSRHMRIHTGRKPHGCNICSYSSIHLYDLKRHMLKHTGLKPFKCEICIFKTNQKCNLRTHIRLKHSNVIII